MGDILASIRQEFLLSPDKFKAIVEGFKTECEHGLSTASASGLATMIPSFVTRMPTGNETGTFLALDLGGSTLRVSAVQLLGNGQVKVTEVRRLITDTLRSGTTDTFFDWIVDTVAELIETIPRGDDGDRPLAMGVSWSFPLDQTGICKGTVLRMGKGFNLQGIDGQDLATLFSDACKRKGVNVVVTALLNDTVGALVAHAYTNPQARVGFVYGTGVNAAYPEKVSRMTKLGHQLHQWQEHEEMLVNTEIDIFGSDAYLPRTRFDKQLDASHSQPDFQLYEKMMSGAYLGELTRLVAVELISNKRLFVDQQRPVPAIIKKPWSFVTAHMSKIEGCSHESMEERQARLCKLFEIDAISPDDVQVLTELCEMVATRGAGLASAAIAAIIEQQPELLAKTSKDIVIGVNGTTFDAYPNMPDRMFQFLEDWFGQETAKRIKLQPARDGGAIGGALIAMLYQEAAGTPTLLADEQQATQPPSSPVLMDTKTAATTPPSPSSSSSSSSSPSPSPRQRRTNTSNKSSTTPIPVSLVKSMFGIIVSCLKPRRRNATAKTATAKTAAATKDNMPNEMLSDEEKKL